MGSAAIDLGVLSAIVAALSALVGAASPDRRPSAHRVAAVSLATSAAFTAFAVALLGRALWTVDPALTYVSRHSSQQTPLPYRIAGIWGGMEGSLLFWAFVVACTFTWAAKVGRSRPSDEVLAIAGIGGTTAAVFLFISRTWASPFETLDAPSGSGNGLLAVLQHPAMVYHPPVLYLGLALTGVPFALTLLALVQRRLDRRWRATVIPWLRAGWLVLGVGIVTGSQWAYAELGWGGFWAWDPVENSSLLPWLATTVAIHLLVAQEGRLGLSGASAIVGAFCLMVCGVYVTRSGNTGSIHAFSEAPQVARPLLVFAAFAGIAGTIALIRHGADPAARPRSRRVSILGLQGGLGAIAIAAIAVGTFWPVVDGLVFSNVGTRTLVRPDYYHRALAPVAGFSLLAMAAGPILVSSHRRHSRPLKQLAICTAVGAASGFLIAVAAVGSIGWLTVNRGLVAACAGVAIAGSTLLVATTARRPSPHRRTLGIAVAHGGFAIVLLGAVASSGGVDDTVRVTLGETVELGSSNGDDGLQLAFVDLVTGRTNRYEFVRGVVDIGPGNDLARYEPELRAYEQQRIPTAEAVIAGGLTGDTIVVLEAVADDLGTATFTIRTRPLLPWVWVGAVLVIAGGLATLGGPRRESTTALDVAQDQVVTTTPR